MDQYLRIILILQSLYLLLHTAANAYSIALHSKTKGRAGLTPESPIRNFIIDCILAAAMFMVAVHDADLAYGYTCLLIFLVPIVYGTIHHLRQYFVYKAMLRQARALYKETGVKSNLDLAGYASLNTLMLAVVINVYGFFAVGAGVYYYFVGFSTDQTGSELDWIN